MRALLFLLLSLNSFATCEENLFAVTRVLSRAKYLSHATITVTTQREAIKLIGKLNQFPRIRIWSDLTSDYETGDIVHQITVTGDTTYLTRIFNSLGINQMIVERY